MNNPLTWLGILVIAVLGAVWQLVTWPFKKAWKVLRGR